MPQKNQSNRIGKSSSKMIDRVIQQNKNGQQPGSAPGMIKQAFNKHPVPCKK